uniref:Uncharacterized protein n=1 Tax=Anguilla anguilla TaxID=7936 RepID=A0A0E9WXW0_ANGAN
MCVFAHIKHTYTETGQESTDTRACKVAMFTGGALKLYPRGTLHSIQ